MTIPNEHLSEDGSTGSKDIVLQVRNLNVYYEDFLAVKDVTMDVKKKSVTALIGPSDVVKALF